MSLAGVLSGAEAVQGAVHVGGSHAPSHRRKATQVHCEYIHCLSHLLFVTPFALTNRKTRLSAARLYHLTCY